VLEVTRNGSLEEGVPREAVAEYMKLLKQTKQMHRYNLETYGSIRNGESVFAIGIISKKYKDICAFGMSIMGVSSAL
jgi:hypothetical protein